MRYENNKIVYEVGDWVTFPKTPVLWSSAFSDNYPINKPIYPATFQIEKYSEEGMLGMNYGWSTDAEYFRPATQGEIDRATEEEKIMVGKNEVEFYRKFNDEPCHKITVGCQEVSKELFLKIGKKAKWID